MKHHPKNVHMSGILFLNNRVQISAGK